MTVGGFLDMAMALLRQPTQRERLDDYRASIRTADFLCVALADNTELVSVLDDLRLLLRSREQAIIAAIQSPHRAGEVRSAKISQDARTLHRRIREVAAGGSLTHQQLAQRFGTSTKTIQRALKKNR